MTADTVGGVWTYTVELCRALRPLGVEVTLATMGPPIRADRRAQLRRIPDLRLHESTFRLEWMDNPWDDVARAAEWLLCIADRARPDLVHLNGYAHAGLDWRVPTVVVAHTCVLSWWRAVRGTEPPPAWREYAAAVTRGLGAASTVIAPSFAMAAALQAHHGPLRALRVIPNGRALRVRRAMKQLLVMAAGRVWDDAKNIAALDRVAARLPVPVYVAGESGPQEAGLRPLIAAHALGDLSQTELSSWLARAAIYALPARYEPFGLSILEAALAGCALVLGDIPSLREVWGDAALFAPPDDERALEAAIRRLAGDPELRDAMAARARRRAEEYTPGRMASEYIGAYRGLLSGTVPARGLAHAS